MVDRITQHTTFAPENEGSRRRDSTEIEITGLADMHMRDNVIRATLSERVHEIANNTLLHDIINKTKALKNQLKISKEQQIELKNEAAAAALRTNELEKRVEQTEADVLRLEKLKEQMNEETTHIENSLAQSKAYASELEQKLETNQQEVAQVTKQLTQAQEKTKNLELELDKRIDAFQKKQEENTRTIVALEQEVAETKKKIRQLGSELEQAKNAQSIAESRAATANETIEDLEAKLAAFQNQITQLRDQLNTATRAKQAADETLGRTKNELEDMSRKVSMLEKQAEESKRHALELEEHAKETLNHNGLVDQLLKASGSMQTIESDNIHMAAQRAMMNALAYIKELNTFRETAQAHIQVLEEALEERNALSAMALQAIAEE